MGIEALPSSTVRTIGATQVLNDPASVIKELIDNALDACSTSISIEIHNNTVDSIQVRDNGHGIPPDDRLLVARPHCTSKISGEGDLKSIGATSLGFRGEALASAAEMSGSLTISTRVEGEEVATALKINQQGEVVKQDRASLPVGTTVKITDFIKAHPVRRQVALKNAEKTLAKIKETLKAYAFARPHVRLSLRVLKAKNDKGNWTYAPKPGGNAEDAAFKVVGSACASQCVWSVVEEDGYSLQAFLPKVDAEVSKCSSIGAFLSVDARPVSAARGAAKQIVKMFREALKKANPKADGVKEPFFFLEMRCPSASYDANVEPAKDDVLFENPDMLIDLVRRLFEAVYPAQTASEPVAQSMAANRQADLEKEDDFVTSLERTAARNHRHQPSVPWMPFATNEQLLTAQDQGNTPLLSRASRPNMYGRDEEDFDDDAVERSPTENTEANFEELREARHDVDISNPWILAKLNAPVRQRLPPYEDGDDVVASISGVRAQQEDIDRTPYHADAELGLPTPGPSSPIKRTDAPCSVVESAAAAVVQDCRSIGSQPLPPPGPTIRPPPRSPFDPPPEPSEPQPRHARACNYNPSEQVVTKVSDTPLHAIPDSSSRRRQSPRRAMQQAQINPPFRPPINDQPLREKVWFDHLENADRPRVAKRPYQPRHNDGLVVQGELGELVDAPRPLTPPRRNRDVREYFTPAQESDISITDVIDARQFPQQTRTRRLDEPDAPMLHDGENDDPTRAARIYAGFIPASELTAIEDGFNSPKLDTLRAPKRRKTRERQVLRQISGNAPVEDETAGETRGAIPFSPDEPTRPLTAERIPGKTRRRKSSRLPLERVPKGQGTHNLVVNLSNTIEQISSISGNIDKTTVLLQWNEPAIDPCDGFSTMFEDAAIEAITAKLHELLTAHIPGGEMVQDLGVVVRDAFAAHTETALEMDV